MSKEIRVGDKIKWSDDSFTVKGIREGGMGIVYICHSYRYGPSVLKTFKDKYNSQIISETFCKECETWIKIGNHLNIVKALSIDFIEGKPFVQLEYCKYNLSEYVRLKQLTMKDYLNIWLDIVKGLNYTSSRIQEFGFNFVHRDLKPENILMDGYSAKISDFGISQCYQNIDDVFFRNVSINANAKTQYHATKIGQVCGTPPYMSPEQCSGKSLSIQSDIYSIGCIMYEMVTGRYLFNVKEGDEFIHSHMVVKPNPPIFYVKSLDKKVDELIMQCLDKNPRNRPTPKQLMCALFELLGEDSSTAIKDEEKYQRMHKFLGFQLDQEIENWVKLFVLGKYSEANAFINEYARKNGLTEADLNLRIVRFFVYKNMFDSKSLKAISYLLNRLIAVEPRSIYVGQLLGIFYSETGKKDEAINIFKVIINFTHKEIQKRRDALKNKDSSEMSEAENGIKDLECVMIEGSHELAWVYYKRSDMKSVKETCAFLLDSIGESYQSSFYEKELLGKMFERIGYLDLAIKFYKNGRPWDAFRLGR